MFLCQSAYLDARPRRQLGCGGPGLANGHVPQAEELVVARRREEYPLAVLGPERAPDGHILLVLANLERLRAAAWGMRRRSQVGGAMFDRHEMGQDSRVGGSQ